MSSQPQPSATARIALLATAALPWYAMLSGIYGLYFYILLLTLAQSAASPAKPSPSSRSPSLCCWSFP